MVATSSRPRSAASTRTTCASRIRCSAAASPSSGSAPTPSRAAPPRAAMPSASCGPGQRPGRLVRPRHLAPDQRADQPDLGRPRPGAADARTIMICASSPSIPATKIFNAFLQNSAGNYYFDSIADFQAGIASSPRLRQRRSVARSGRCRRPVRLPDATRFGMQDTWRINAGLRRSITARATTSTAWKIGPRSAPRSPAAMRGRSSSTVTGGDRPNTANHRRPAACSSRASASPGSPVDRLIDPRRRRHLRRAARLTSIFRTASRTPAS